ncbi:MAG: helix-turn-helix domain-containing protein [Lentisphaeria bacterium]|nr:helix-turn-helix domain-containing protein [Lentisphaeria bacterium]
MKGAVSASPPDADPHVNGSPVCELPELLFARRVCYAPCYSRKWHAIRENQIFHIFRGRVMLELESGECCEGTSGDTLFLPAGVRHRDRFSGGEVPELLHMRFLWKGPASFFAAPPDFIRRFPAAVRADIAAQFHLLHLPQDRMDGGFDTPSQKSRITLQLGVILMTCVENLSPLPARFHDRGELRFSEALRFMDDRLECRLTLESVASHLRVSPRTLSRTFRRCGGVSFHRWLLARRLERARVLLEEGEVPLAEIALSTGFGDPGHFGKVFKKHFGVTPGKFC